MLKKVLIVLLVIIVTLTMIVPSVLIFADEEDKIQDNPEQLTVVFTHDIHSHLEKFPVLSTVIKGEKEKDPNTLLVDAGDFSMGTPYQTIYKKEASELIMMGLMGFDAVTLGNHEFDYRSSGLATMLSRAMEVKHNYDEKDSKKFKERDKIKLALPQIVISNIDWDKTLGEKNLKEDGESLKSALDNYGSKDYTVIEKGGKKVAVFGIFGKQSAEYAPESGTYFKDQIQTAKDIVRKIKEEVKPDFILCLSHSGTNEKEPAESEDDILAKEVSGIDMIVSGHSHSLYPEPRMVNNTLVASCGEYLSHVGIARFAKKGNKFTLGTYEVKALDSSIEEDNKTKEEVNKFKDLVNEEFFNKEGWSWDTVLAKNSYEFTPITSFALEQRDDSLGNLLADSFVYGTMKAEGANYTPVEATVIPAGIVRGSFNVGDVDAAEAYNVLSLGTGKDGEPGYPLVSIYLTGKELKHMAEVDASVSSKMEAARLFTSGLMYSINNKRLFLNRVSEIYKINPDPTMEFKALPYTAPLGKGRDKTIEEGLESGQLSKIENSKLYRVVGDLYSCQMLGSVSEKSKGLLSVTPKDKDGKEISDFEEHIIYRENGAELKEWYAVMSYIDDFSGDQFPAKYAKEQNRKIVEDSGNLIQLVKNPGKVFWILVCVIVLVILILALVITLIIKTINKITGRGKTKYKKGPSNNIFGPSGTSVYQRGKSKGNNIFKHRKNKYKSKW